MSKLEVAPANTTLSMRERRNQLITQEYKRIYGTGKRHEVILEELGQKYFLQPDTIERIVWGIGYYKPKETGTALA